MFNLEDEDASQSELTGVEVNCFGFDMSPNQYSINCEHEEHLASNKSEIYRRLELNKNMFTMDSTDTSALTSRLENLILNGSESVPTCSLIYSSQFREVETRKIVNASPIEIADEFEIIDLAGDTAPSPATEGRRDAMPDGTMAWSIVDESFSSPVVAPLRTTEQRRRRFVMGIVIGSVIGVTTVIIVIGKFYTPSNCFSQLKFYVMNAKFIFFIFFIFFFSIAYL